MSVLFRLRLMMMDVMAITIRTPTIKLGDSTDTRPGTGGPGPAAGVCGIDMS
jgi:hypothetical protein